MSRTFHLSQLPSNKVGRDIIVGDIHGKNRGLTKILASLEPGDRFFCSGDVLDRGPDSIGICQTLKAYQEKGLPIFVTCGNHEVFFLATMSALTAWRSKKTLSATQANDVLLHISNGGSWIYGDKNQFSIGILTAFLTQKESLVADTTLTKIEKSKQLTALKKQYVTLLLSGCDCILMNEALWKTLNDIKTMVESFPYIIFVGDFKEKQNAFLVCHADMPIDNLELEERLGQQKGKGPFLSAAEINHAIWARPDSLKNKIAAVPGIHAIITYTGHNVVHTIETKAIMVQMSEEDSSDESEFLDTAVVRPLRKETHTVVLDVSGWSFKNPEDELFLMVDHTNATAFVDGTAASVDPLNILMEEITCYLCEHQKIAARLNNLLSMQASLLHYLDDCRLSSAMHTLFSPREKVDPDTAATMLQEIEKLLRNDPTEATSVWQPKANLPLFLEKICDRLQTARMSQPENWVLVESLPA